MMFSGHTFFATLNALGLYEVALIWTNCIAPQDELIDPEQLKNEQKPRNAQFRLPNSRSKMLHARMERKNKWSPGAKATFRASVLACVSTLAIGQQRFEIYYVLLSHFHHTSDVIVALMLTFLFYSATSTS